MPGSAPQAAPDDGVILDMYQAMRLGEQTRLSALLPRARGHALEPWAAYWELSARLMMANAQEVNDFLNRYAGTYQEDRLRNDWLLMAGQRRDWASFAAEYPRFRMRDDMQVRCYAVAMQLALRQEVTPADVDQARANWFALRELDDGCMLAVELLHKAGKLPTEDLWKRARLALAANRPALARAAAELAAPNTGGVEVAQIQNSAARYLNGNANADAKANTRTKAKTKGRAKTKAKNKAKTKAKAQASATVSAKAPAGANAARLVATPLGRELATLALIKLASGDIKQAEAQLQSDWAAQLDAQQRNWLWGMIGRQAAQRLEASALDDFAKVTHEHDLSDDMLAWQTRAALRLGQWPIVERAIEAMSEPEREKSVWVYWRARAKLALARSDADRDAARKLLAGISGVGGFYEKLAAEELGQPIKPAPAPAPLTVPEREAARDHPGLNRALLAIRLGLRSEGVREWNYWTNLHQSGGMDDRELYAAADVACQHQLWDRCVNTSERTKSFADFTQRFPTPYRDAVTRQAQAAGLDAAYVYGLIRQESRFQADVRSVAGAHGLMQLMPATARWMARKIGLNDFTPSQTGDPDTNLLLGTRYLKLVLDGFHGSRPLATAAYNAGPSRSRAWRNGPVMEGAIWAENVPFAETRNYVKQVLSNTIDYATLLTGQPQSLKARLGSIEPAPAGEDAQTQDLP